MLPVALTAMGTVYGLRSIDGTLTVDLLHGRWPDGHVSEYSAHFLLEHAAATAQSAGKAGEAGMAGLPSSVEARLKTARGRQG